MFRFNLFLFGLALGVGGFFAYRRLHPPPPPVPLDAWEAISPAYVKEAMAEAAGKKLVPFCQTIRADGTLAGVGACKAWDEAHSEQAFCALQNLGPKGWDASVVKGSVPKAAAEIGAWLTELHCETLLLDIESTRDRVATTAWFQGVIAGLRREFPRLKVAVAVHGKKDDKGTWYAAAAQDWPALCEAADELVLMTYDFHFPGITPAGETAPLPWVEEVLRYALTTCPNEKLRLGLAAYGYDFRTKAVVTERAWVGKGKPDPEFIYAESAAQRAEKEKLARKYGLSRTFLWAAGMAAEPLRNSLK